MRHFMSERFGSKIVSARFSSQSWAKFMIETRHDIEEMTRTAGLLPDNSRKRTPGGVFFYLCKTQAPEEVRKLFLWLHKKKAHGKEHKPVKPQNKQEQIQP